MPRVTRLSIAPVKALGLVHPEEIELETTGVPEDRRFYILDDRGRLFTGSKLGPLVRVRVEYDQGRLALRFPDGEVAGGEVRVAGGREKSSFWGRPVHGSAVIGPWSDALSRYAGRQLRLMRADPSDGGWDEYPASVVSTASLEELARHAGVEGRVDARRFRMLIEVTGCAPHEEDEWIGRSVRAGEAILRVEKPDSRCVVTTQDPDTGIGDLNTLETIAAYRGRRDGKIDFGMYAAVDRPGRVRVGDPVEPAD